MKPQCTTAAECLRELARVMEQFGIKSIIDAVNSKYVKHYNGNWNSTEYPFFQSSNHWSFAIAEVEGKPVFPGDELYHSGYGKVVVRFSERSCEYVKLEGYYGLEVHICGLSWNPPKPKPKTVMIEMLVEDAEEWAKMNERAISLIYRNLANSCKKALETK